MSVAPVLLLALSMVVGASEPPWPGFRGPGGVPASDNEKLPLRWSTTENVEWVVEVPGSGWSSPIVADGKVFLTTAIGSTAAKKPEVGTDFSNEYMADLRAQGLPGAEVLEKHNARYIEFPAEVELEYLLIAYALEDGRELWRHTFFRGPPPGGRHAKNSFTSETPVSDGETIFVYVGNLGLWAISLDGEERWHKELDAFEIFLNFGTGGSPALMDDQVVVLNDNQEHQFIAAFSKADGREQWRTARDTMPDAKGSQTGWTSPFVWRHEGRTEIIALGPSTVLSYDTHGRELWRMSNQSRFPVPTPFAYQGKLFVTSGVHGDSFRPITSIESGASGDLTLLEGARSSESVRWYDPAAGTYLPTPVAYRGSLWVVYDRGFFARYDATTGEQVFKARIQDSARAFTASPWAYRGRIFATDEEGTTFVFGTGDEIEQLHANPLDEMVLASPALVGDRLLMRTKTRLYSLRER